MIETVVRRGGIALAAVAAGPRDAPPVLLAHGYPDTHAIWASVNARLARDHRVIAYDTRGAGASTRPRGAHAYDLTDLADDMAAVIDALSPGRAVHVVGHDWGSIEAWELCTTSRADGRVASFTSISGPCLDHVGHWVASGRVRELAAQLARSWYIGGLAIPGVAERIWPRLAPWWPDAAPTLAADGATGAARYRQNVARRLRRPRADARARVPVQLIVPRRDRFVSRAMVDQAARWTPSLAIREIDAGHWVPRTAPEELTGWIAAHVAATESLTGPGA